MAGPGTRRQWSASGLMKRTWRGKRLSANPQPGIFSGHYIIAGFAFLRIFLRANTTGYLLRLSAILTQIITGHLSSDRDCPTGISLWNSVPNYSLDMYLGTSSVHVKFRFREGLKKLRAVSGTGSKWDTLRDNILLVWPQWLSPYSAQSACQKWHSLTCQVASFQVLIKIGLLHKNYERLQKCTSFAVLNVAGKSCRCRFSGDVALFFLCLVYCLSLKACWGWQCQSNKGRRCQRQVNGGIGQCQQPCASQIPLSRVTGRPRERE